MESVIRNFSAKNKIFSAEIIFFWPNSLFNVRSKYNCFGRKWKLTTNTLCTFHQKRMLGSLFLAESSFGRIEFQPKSFSSETIFGRKHFRPKKLFSRKNYSAEKVYKYIGMLAACSMFGFFSFGWTLNRTETRHDHIEIRPSRDPSIWRSIHPRKSTQWRRGYELVFISCISPWFLTYLIFNTYK